MTLRGFYFITDRMLCAKSEEDSVRQAIRGGARIVQYREKELGFEHKIEAARRLKRICGKDVVLIVNDDVEVALASHADGVHLGHQDRAVKEARLMAGANMVIGVTARNVDDAVEAFRSGADYVAVSPIFATSTKRDAGEPVGAGMIRRVKDAVNIPVAAIGGINESNIDEVVDQGADMVCAISATVTREDISSAVEFFAKKIG